mmetsp:Transcript_31336/g.90341  ORF Transcript_31336/g.90341 Transcript_31336/m.90341 type:complete len:257 (+) Transcript_31336:400-1170(+)
MGARPRGFRWRRLPSSHWLPPPLARSSPLRLLRHGCSGRVRASTSAALLGSSGRSWTAAHVARSLIALATWIWWRCSWPPMALESCARRAWVQPWMSCAPSPHSPTSRKSRRTLVARLASPRVLSASRSSTTGLAASVSRWSSLGRAVASALACASRRATTSRRPSHGRGELRVATRRPLNWSRASLGAGPRREKSPTPCYRLWHESWASAPWELCRSPLPSRSSGPTSPQVVLLLVTPPAWCERPPWLTALPLAH